MFRILVADDEKITRKGVITMLKRGLKEEVEYFEASNGEQALKIVKDQMIHLIITDICMPLLSGLEFISELRKKDDEMKIIIISAYENFEYAKKAVQLDVENYITKPLHKDELLGVTEYCFSKIRKKQLEIQQLSEDVYKRNLIMKHVQNDALLQIVEGTNVTVGMQQLQLMNITIKGKFYLVAKFIYEWNKEHSEIVDFAMKNIMDECLEKEFENQYLSVISKPRQHVILFHINEVSEIKEIVKGLAKIVRIVEQVGRVKAIAGIGKIVYCVEDIAKSYKQANIATDCKIFNINDKVICYDSLPQLGVEHKMVNGNKLEFVDLKSDKEVEIRFAEILKWPVSVEAVTLLRKEYEKYVESCFRMGEKEEYGEILDFSEFWNIFQLRHEVKLLRQFCVNYKEEKEGKYSKTQLVNDVLDFAIQHVTEEIDLNYIAESFGKTPGYIGTIFKRERNQGFNEFITGERIKIAKKLLKDTSLSIQEVSERCGYHNAKYFSIVFKKLEEISPKTYQMMLKKEKKSE